VRFDNGMQPPESEHVIEPSGWAAFRPAAREIWHDARHVTPRALRYLACDGCGEVTQHSTDLLDIVREAVCDECGHPQIRTMGDEAALDVTVMCGGRRMRRWRRGRSRGACGHLFAVPSAARVVPCPWCSTVQPNPGRR
jgi:hypothetical protein